MQLFVASVNQEGDLDGDERYLELRRKIHRLGVPMKLDPWVAEEKEPDLPTRGWRATIDTCVHALHGSDVMLILLYRRLGTPIHVDRLGPSPVTYLEIELFHAALRRIPLLVFQASDFIPDPRLATMIDLLRRIVPADQWTTAPRRELEEAVLETVRWLRDEDRRPRPFAKFCDALSDDKSSTRVETEVGSIELSFLHNFAPGAAGQVSLDRVDLCLAEAGAITGENSHVDRLSRLWMALRDLAQNPADRMDVEIARRWIGLCELWTSSAAWLDLHGPLELSVLATLHTRAEIRNAGLIEERLFPYGAYASEAYSIGKTSDTLQWQRRRFEAARRLATKQIDVGSIDPSGAYGVRASASMQLAQRGRQWLAVSGLLDYRSMLRVRERRNASDSEIGEAMVELGYAEFAIGRRLAWTRRSALQRVREGVRLMESDHPERRAGFVRRAKLKLIDVLEQSGAVDEAAAERKAREAFARANGLPPD